MRLANDMNVTQLVSWVYPDSNCGDTFGLHEMKYNQESNKLYLLCDLYPFFMEENEHGEQIYNKAKWNHFHKTLTFQRGKGSKITDMQLANMIFSSFYENKNVVMNPTGIAEGKQWVDESYEDCQLRNCWQMMDLLGKKHHGYGHYLSQDRELKYYRPPPKQTDNLDLELD